MSHCLLWRRRWSFITNHNNRDFKVNLIGETESAEICYLINLDIKPQEIKQIDYRRCYVKSNNHLIQVMVEMKICRNMQSLKSYGNPGAASDHYRATMGIVLMVTAQ